MIIAVVSLPPPVTGQAVAARLLVDELDRRGVDHRVINTASPVVKTGSRSTVLRAAARTAGRTLGSAVTALVRSGAAKSTTLYLQMGMGPSSIIRDIPILAVAALRRWRVVGHVHGGGWREGLDQVPAPLRTLYLRLLRRAETLIVLTPRLRSMFDGLVEADRVTVIGNGVEHVVTKLAADQPAQWSSNPTVLFLSNLMPEKGADTVVAAAHLAAKDHPAMRFRFAGALPDGVDAIDWPSNCEWVGEVTGAAKVAFLASGTVFAFPTRYWVEGQPISILEAMHLGLPIVACDRGGIADVVGPENGIIIPPDEPEALLDAVLSCVVDEQRWASMSTANRTAATTLHTATRHLDTLVAVLAP